MDTQRDYYNEQPQPPVMPAQEPPAPAPKGYVALKNISNVLSGVFSPLLIPTYAYAIVMWTTKLSALPERMRLISSLIVLLITAIVPFGVILGMMRKGKIADPAISNHKERVVPYMVTILCYFAAAIYTWRLPFWIPRFFVGAAIATIIASVINVKWKISAHATAMGGLCAALVFIGLARIYTVVFMPWIATAIILSGAVCSARLFLHRHTPGQVYAGWILGFAATFAAILI